MMSKFNITTAFLPNDSSLLDLQAFAKGHGNIKVGLGNRFALGQQRTDFVKFQASTTILTDLSQA